MTIRKRGSDRSGRDKPRSPGRPKAAHREQYALFRRLIAEGVSSEVAAVQVGASAPVGSRWFREAGGMPPSQFSTSAPPLSGRYPTFAEREEIAPCRARGPGVCAIARKIGRAASTVSRELRRNAATRGGGFEHRATTARWHENRAADVTGSDGEIAPGPDVAWTKRRSARRQHRRRATAWSPEQIARRLPLDYPEDDTMRISHEAMYQALFIQGRGALRREPVACLRSGRALRVPGARRKGKGKAFVSEDIMISERPAECHIPCDCMAAF